MNTELLERIAAHIEAYPESFVMNEWITDCGTSACIAGHALLMTGTPPDSTAPDMPWTVDNPYSSAALAVLKIDKEQAHRLFFQSYWPKQFWGLNEYDEPCEYENVTPENAVARIRHFIATEGRE